MRTQTPPIFRRLLLAVSIEPEEIGARIARARDAKHWSQLDLALKFDVSVSSVSRWENGTLPSIKRLLALAELLEINPNELVEAAPTDDDQIGALREEVAELRRLVSEIHQATVA